MSGKPEHAVAVDASTKVDMAGVKEGSRGRFVLCFLGIFVSYMIYGLLQEQITKSRYGPDDEKFTYTTALVFIQCVVNAGFAYVAIQMYKTPPETAPQGLYAIMSFSYIGAMLASNHSLQYVSYPTQVLGKSAKPIPVMILGVLLAKKKYPIQKYFFVLLIVLGVAMFMYKDKKAATDVSEHIIGWGELLLLLSLALDGVTGGIQDKIREQHRMQTYRMMFYMNLWSVFYLAIGLVITGEGLGFIKFATAYPQVLLSMLTFSVCSAVGQNFIFMTVNHFGPLPCSIMTTTRKFFSILGSVLIFGNPISSRQWGGTVFVFAGLGLDSFYGKSRKPVKPETKE